MITEFFEQEHIAACQRDELTGTEWAERYRVLTTVSSSLAGPYRANVFRVAKGVLDSVTSENVIEVAWCSGTQNAKTETILNAIGYFMHQRPAPIMLVYPEKNDCQFMSKVRIQDMIDNASDSILLNRVEKSTMRQDVFNIGYIGGYLTFAWASSVNRLASKPVPYIFLDEIDKFTNISKHGSPLLLVRERQKAFFKTLLFMASSPTHIEGEIWKAIHKSDYLFKYKVPCISCRGVIEFDIDHIKADETGVFYNCNHCGNIFYDKDKPALIDSGSWVTDVGESLTNILSSGIRLRLGFHSSSFHSPFISFTDIWNKYLSTKDDPEAYRVFVNGWLAKPFDNSIYQLEHSPDNFLPRLEEIDILPRNILMLTAGVDVQNDRLEVQVIGFGVGRQTYVVDRKFIFGDPRNIIVWRELQAFIMGKRYKHVVGRNMPILATAVDTGFLTTECYTFCKSLEQQRVYAIKGTGRDIITDVSRPIERGVMRCRLYTLNVNKFKDNIYHFLGINEEGDGYVHFNSKVCDIEYFDQLTAEKKQVSVINGKLKSEWVKVRQRNEALDTMIYAHAAYMILDPDINKFDEIIQNDYEKMQQDSQ